MALPTAGLMVLLSAGPAAATHEAPGVVPLPPPPPRPPACGPAPSWVEAAPDSTSLPAPGLRLRSWHGPGRLGVPLRVVAAEADTVRIGLTVSVPPILGAALVTTQLTDRAGVVLGVNGDYFDYRAAGAVPRGVEVADGTVLYAPPGPTAAVGMGTDGAVRAGQVRVSGSIEATLGGTVEQLAVSSVNAGSAAAEGIAVQTAFGALQRRRAAWFVVVRDGVAVSSSATDPGPPTGADVLLMAPDADRAPLSRVTPGTHVRVSTLVRGADGVPLTDALGSSDPILREGAIVVGCTGDFGTGWRPRTIVAWNNRTARLWLVTVNSVTTGVSGTGIRGLTYGEAADVARYLGASDAVLLDGGRSTTFAGRTAQGAVRIDAPADAPMRPVADALVLAPS